MFDATGIFSYSPYVKFAPFLGPPLEALPAVAPSYDLAVAAQRNTSVTTSLALTSNYSARSSFSAEAHYSHSGFLDHSSENVGIWGGSATFQRHLTRTLAWHLGYGRDQIRYAFKDSRPLTSDSINAGLDYGSALSFSRRTTLAFSTSTGAIRYGNHTYYRVDGNATLTRGFARTWSASLSYLRGIDFLPGFGQPLLSDSVNAQVGGLVARRVQWASGVGASYGTVGFTGSNTFSAYTATSSISIAIRQSLGLFGQYGFYGYHVPAGSAAFELLPRSSLHSVTVGLSVWAPIIRDLKVPRDPG
jgi:hypothetical protein